MTMQAEDDRINAKPAFYIKGDRVYKEGRAMLNADGTLEMSMGLPVCTFSEYLETEDFLKVLIAGYTANEAVA